MWSGDTVIGIDYDYSLLNHYYCTYVLDSIWHLVSFTSANNVSVLILCMKEQNLSELFKTCLNYRPNKSGLSIGWIQTFLPIPRIWSILNMLAD